MKVDLEIVNDDASYRDLEIYVVEDTGAEWKFRVYLDKELGLILESDPMYSPNSEDCFDETDLPVPPAVRDVLDAQRPRVYKLLKGDPMKKTYEVELRRTSFITVTVEAKDEDEAEALAWQESMTFHSNHDASWDIESIEEVTNQGE